MNIRITTKIAQPYQQVAQKFDQDLLLAVSPPLPAIKLLRYDGNQPGDEVHVELRLLFFKQSWKSLITAYHEDADHICFIDEGIQLPFFLSYWQHKHIIKKNSIGSQIIDDVTFRAPFFLMDYLLYPIMYFQFLYRKPVYKKYFTKQL